MEAKGSGTVLSELELAIETMVKYYNKYSGKEFLVCGKEAIQKSSFKKMLQTELSHMLTNTKNKEAVTKLFQDLDQDGDSMIDFDEYWDLIGSIVKAVARGAKGSESVPGELESAVQTIVDYYDKYSTEEGIRKSNFKRMLQSELNHMLTNTKNKEAVRKLFRDLDQNGDGVINFNEYWALIEEIIMPVSRMMEHQVEKTAAESKGNNNNPP